LTPFEQGLRTRRFATFHDDSQPADDHLGSTAFVTDASGGLAEHLQYMPGGEAWVEEHPSQPVPQQYTGKELDPEAGLYYYGARYYDPRTQQWQSPDPVLAGTPAADPRSTPPAPCSEPPRAAERSP
jgi:RHS repeat-associated protein